jgi:hemoglobin/transferrin/lactoferrin receptor protein
MAKQKWTAASAILATSALFSPGLLAAEDTKQTTEKSSTVIPSVKVSANRSEQTLESVTKSVSVVDNEAIQTRQATNLTTLMNELPGVSMAPDGMLSGQIVIRGFSTQNFRAPLFINGDRFRGRNTLEYLLLDPNQVERVEVIRGPASSLYGTDSFGGVINVTTKRAEGDVMAPFKLTNSLVDMEYQSVNNGYAGRLQLAGAGDGFDVLLGLNARNAEDYESPEGTIPNSDYNVQNYDARIGYTFTEGQRVEVIAKSADVTRGRAGGQFAAPGAGNEPGQLQREMREDPMREDYVSLGYKGEFDNAWVESVEASLYRRELYTHVHVVPNTNNPSTYVDSYVNGPVTYGGRLIAVAPWSSAPVVSTYGLDWYDERRDSSEQRVKGGPKKKTSPKSYQQNVGVFMLQEWDTTDRLTLSGSLRYDYVKTGLDTDYITDPTTKALFDDAGDTENTQPTGGIGAIYMLNSNFDLVGNVNTSFRAPSTTEVSAVGTGVYSDFRIPNPDIKPETGITYEIGTRFHSRTVRANLTAFRSDFDNLITTADTTYNGNPAKQIQNVGKATINGVEFDITWKPTREVTAMTNISWIEGRDTVSNEPLPQIMPLNGFASLRYDAASQYQYYFEGTTEWATDNDVVDKSIERERAGYMVFNFYTGVNPGIFFGQYFKDTDLRFGIENIFDVSYSMPTVPENINYPKSKTNPLVQPGRNFKVGLTIGF